MQDEQGSKTQLTTSEFDKRTPSRSPNGQKIIYRSGNRELYLFDLDTKEEKLILQGKGWAIDPVFLDNSHIVFSHFDSNLADESDLWISDLEGKELTLLTHEPGLQYSPSLSKDGKQLVFVSGKGFGNHELYLYHFDTKETIRLTNNRALELKPDFSPDGTKIIYASDENGSFDLYVMELTTKKVIRLTDWPGAELSPTWSTDGQKIAFVSDRSGIMQIWVADQDGKNERVLIEDLAPAQEPSWR